VLGYGEHVHVDWVTATRSKGALFVLCTDGVWQALDDSGVAKVMGDFVKSRPINVGLTDAANALVRAANATSYGDNATAVVIECT
jgi:serine/threonine protein phosphatase PrpC